MRRVIIVSPQFPPSTLAGVHRARHLTKHLPAYGWSPAVICVDPQYHVEELDPELAKLVPKDAQVIYSGAIPVSLTRPFGLIGEIGLRGFFHLRAAIAGSIAEQKPDAVLITGAPFYPMLLARWIRRTWGIPVVLDFQDPWVSREGALRKRWSKGWLSHRLAITLEPLAVRGASWITSVSALQNKELAERYLWFNKDRMSAIPIGGDPEDFASILDSKKGQKSSINSGLIEFSYVGAAWPRSMPLLRILLRGLAIFVKENPDLSRFVRFRFVGTNSQPGNTRDLRVKPLAIEEGVGSYVVEEPARVPFLEALDIQASASISLMFGSDEPHYTASKIYTCLMAGRPFISLFHHESSAHSILTDAGGGIALAFNPEVPLVEMERSVADAVKKVITNPQSIGAIDPNSYEEYTAKAVAGNFARVLELAGRP